MVQLEALLNGLDDRLQNAVQTFWSVREAQRNAQIARGRLDAGMRGAVTGGAQMIGLERLVTSIIRAAGLPDTRIITGKPETPEESNVTTGLELPGYYRPEKKWDMLILSHGLLVAAIEYKSQVGSLGNNINNRSEEVIGCAEDIRKAHREGRFQYSPKPFLGYLFLLEDSLAAHSVRGPKEPHFDVDPVFKTDVVTQGKKLTHGVSYAKRYEILLRRLQLEELYTATCLLLATRVTADQPLTNVTQPASDLAFRSFMAALIGHVYRFMLARPWEV
ncbi:MAG: PaeR7I family type II restriction endonuclease [Chloroflexi bacterium]|nr:PaeR7I family type II restriction endonuclease [Chloroflexota bacterium]